MELLSVNSVLLEVKILFVIILHDFFLESVVLWSSMYSTLLEVKILLSVTTSECKRT